MVNLSYVIIILGILFIIAGLVGGVAKLLPDIVRRAVQQRMQAETSISFMQALTELVRALIQAPLWLALTVVGVTLVLVGAQLTSAT